MSTTEQINAYLAWRSEREGRTVDVSPEAYERDFLLTEILDRIRNAYEADDDLDSLFDQLIKTVEEYDNLEDN